MERDYIISITLDQRRKLKSGRYPVRLRVYSAGRQKLYATEFKFSPEEFKQVWGPVDINKLPPDARKTNRDLQRLLNKAEDEARELEQFTFEQFEKKLYRKTGDAENVFIQFQEAINHYEQNNQIGTSRNYTCSLNSIKKFIEDKTGKEPEKILFREITPDWLDRYESYMLGKGKSQTTVGIYLRPLRALYKAAIAQGTVKPDLYPFGRRRYEIPQPEAVRKALSREQLKAFFDAQPENEYRARAKDFWFFLFNTAGMNVKDLCRLKYSNLHGDKLVYVREKTKRTTKSRLKPVVVYLNDFARDFINRYGNPDKAPNNFIFGIFTENMTEVEKFERAGAFTRNINQHVKNLAKANGLPEEISTYWSRHSFATNAVRGGASLEQIQQALNHHNLTTTQNYFAGFEDEAMRDLTKNLMNF